MADEEQDALRAQLAYDARLMQEFRHTEAHDCLQRQLDKMAQQCTDHVLTAAETFDQVNFWRGRLSAVRDLKGLPDLIVGYAQRAGMPL